MANTTVVFDTGVTSITIPTPAHGSRTGQAPNQILGWTAGGSPRSTIINPTDAYEPELFWDVLLDADYSSLFTFIETTCNWHQTSFTYTDHDGTDHDNCYYVGGLPFESVGQGGGYYWTGRLLIRQDLEA